MEIGLIFKISNGEILKFPNDRRDSPNAHITGSYTRDLQQSTPMNKKA